MTTTTTAPATIAVIERHALAAALAITTRVVERRNSIPILSCILIDPTDAGARIYGTDLDCAVSVDVAAAWEAPAPIAVDAWAFSDAVAKCAGFEVTLTHTDGRLAVACGDVRFDLAAMNAADMPRVGGDVHARRDAIGFDIPAPTLRDVMTDAGRFVSKEETRYYLNGVFLTVHETELTAVSTHGHGMYSRRLGMPGAAAQLAEFVRHDAGIIIPRKACALVARFINRKDMGAASVAMFRADRGGAFVEMRTGAVTVLTKHIDGSFPAWARVIPGDAQAAALAGVWTVTADALQSFFEGAAAGKDRQFAYSMPDAVTGAPGRTCWNIDGKTSHATLPGQYIGRAAIAGATSRYMLEAAKAFPKGATLSIAVYALPGSGTMVGSVPFVITSDAVPGALVLVMPNNGMAWEEAAAPMFATVAPIPGRAACLFGISPAMTQGAGESGAGLIGIDRPRVANLAEVVAYLADIGARCALPDMRCDYVHYVDGMPQGATFGGMIREARKEALRTLNDATGEIDESFVHLPATWQDGAYSIVMPGRIAAPVLVETLDDAGNVVSCDAVAVNAKGAVAIDETTVQRITGLAPVTRGRKRAAAPIAAPVAAPIADSVAAAPDAAPIAAAAMFTTIAAFKAAAVIGSTWRKVTFDSAGETLSPLFRTVIKVQSRDVAFAMSEAPLAPDVAAAFAANPGAGGSWLGMPKRGQWAPDARGMMFLDSDGAPRFLFIPVTGADLAAIGTNGVPRSPVAADYPELHGAAAQVAATAPVAADPVAPVVDDAQDVAPAPVAAAQDVTAPADDVAALMATVAALAARVASLEAGATPSAAPAQAMRAPRAVRMRMVSAYLRHRAQRDAIREERAAFRKEIAEARASEELAHVQAANARRAATDYKREMESAAAVVDRNAKRRRHTAARLIRARHAAAAARGDAFQAGRRASQAEIALTGAQLASAAAWERVAALQIDRLAVTA